MFNKYLLSVIVWLLLNTQNIFAQHTVTGNIKNIETQQNLTDVWVYINDLKTGVTTNKDGNYCFKNITTGTYLFEINLTGYKKRVERIYVTKDTVINFLIKPAVAELNEIIVTAVSRSTELKLSPIIIKPVDANMLQQNTATNIVDALKNVAGVSQITTGASISKPIIRGLGYNRVISLYNGIKQEGQQWGDEHGLEMDEYSVDRVEIVKGPGSLMYGSDGIAGVLNFISPKALPVEQIKSQFICNYQTNNNLIGYSLSNAGNKKGIQWQGRFTNKLAGNYSNKYDGRVYNSGFKEYDANLFLGITKKWGYTHCNISSFNTTLNLIKGERDSLGKFTFTAANANGSTQTIAATDDDLKGYSIGLPHQTIHHTKILVNNYFILPKGTIHFDVAFQNNKRKELANVLNPNNPTLYLNLNTFNYSFKYNLAEFKGFETSIGINGMLQNHTNKALECIIPNYNLLDIGSFLFTQKTFNKLTLAVGLRFDNREINTKKLIVDANNHAVNTPDSTTTIKFNAWHNSYKSYSGSVGLSYQINKQSTLKFNLSRGFRAPNISEISSNGKHEGTFRYEYGNANLQPEISHQIDIGYFLNTHHINFEFTPFVNFISNYIFSKKLSNVLGYDSIPEPNDPTPAYRFEPTTANLLGGELYLDIHPHPLDWLHVAQSFSYVQAIQNHATDSTKYLPFIAAPKYHAEFKAHFNKVGKYLCNAYVQFGTDHYCKQSQFFKAYHTETATPAYTLLNAGIGADINAFKKPNFMSIYISADNLANIAYQSHLSRLKYTATNALTGKTGVFNMGRNISIKLILNF